MHYFGIAHKDSHRALADCLSTISLLEKMIAIHARFSVELKGKLNEIFVKADFIWAHFFQLDFDVATTQVNDSLVQGDLAEDQLQEMSGPIIIDTKHDLHESRVVNSLQEEDGEKIVVMRSKQEVLKLWQAGLVEGVFQSKDLFNRAAFEQFISLAQTTEEQHHRFMAFNRLQKLQDFSITGINQKCMIPFDLPMLILQFSSLLKNPSPYLAAHHLRQ